MMGITRGLSNLFNACGGGALRRRAVLSPLRFQASMSPTASAAFAWLERENIGIVFDKSLVARQVMGRYSRNGSKRWITLSPKFMHESIENRIDTLVHEIRHAWQDSQNLMLPYNLRYNMEHGLRAAFLHLCIEEADAHAHGVRARKETDEGPSTSGDIAAEFTKWFDKKVLIYRDSFLDEWEKLLATAEAVAAGRNGNRALKDMIDGCHDHSWHAINKKRLFALGRSFAGVNYQRDDYFYVRVDAVLLERATQVFSRKACARVGALQDRMKVLQKKAARAGKPVRKAAATRKRAA